MAFMLESDCSRCCEKECCPKDAYQMWLDMGNKGTFYDFLKGLKGERGEKGDKGERGDTLTIKKTYPNTETLETNGITDLEEGELAIIASDTETEDNAKLFVKTVDRMVYLTDLSGARGIKGEKGEKGDRGDNADIGVTSVAKYVVDFPLDDRLTLSANKLDGYKTLTHNRVTKWGTLHLDFHATSPVDGVSNVIGRLRDNEPKPVTLLEVSVKGSDPQGQGQIFIRANGEIIGHNLTDNYRYIVDLTGYYR